MTYMFPPTLGFNELKRCKWQKSLKTHKGEFKFEQDNLLNRVLDTQEIKQTLSLQRKITLFGERILKSFRTCIQIQIG